MIASPLRVVTSCSGRFHIFDQARELARHDLLYRLITDYPRSYAAKFGVPAELVQPLPVVAAFAHGLRRYGNIFPLHWRDRGFHAAHDFFSRRLAAVLPADADYFIGLSSFCREALTRARVLGISTAVDHGSLYQKEERQITEEEAARWGVTVPFGSSPDWLIEKEHDEFMVADMVFVLSSVARESLIRNGVPPDKIFVNSCGVDIAGFKPAEKRDKTFRVIQVGAMSLRKGTLDTMQAFKEARLLGSELWFVGSAPEASGLKKRVAQLRSIGVRHIESVPQLQLKNYYNQSTVFVLASLAEGFGMVVPQAMACALPVIITENVGAKDLVRDGENGFVVPIRSPEIIADRLRLLHDDPVLARNMGESARATVERGFAWADYGNRLAYFLRNAVTR